MNQRLSKKELVVVAAAIAIGCVLRCSQLDQVAIEHFDEGVYSSTAWYHEVSNEPYPARHLYAPPGLSWTIGIASSIFGPTLGPFVPGLLAGGLTVFFVWGFTRALFGMVAGLVVVLLASLSDYHIVYSRMALTDVPVMMWILLSVWLGATGIDQQRGRLMFLAGLACGGAWWTKYSGLAAAGHHQQRFRFLVDDWRSAAMWSGKAAVSDRADGSDVDTRVVSLVLSTRRRRRLLSGCCQSRSVPESLVGLAAQPGGSDQLVHADGKLAGSAGNRDGADVRRSSTMV